MKFADYITAKESELAALHTQRAGFRTEQESILSGAEAESRAALSEAEQARFDELSIAKRDADESIAAVDAKLAELRTEALADEAATRAATVSAPAAESRKYDEVARVGQEARTYNPDTDKRGDLFLRDVARQFLGSDPSAGERIARHMSEERVERGQYMTRAADTSAFAGLVVPQYLTDMVAPAVAAQRPFADICTNHDLPAEGMTVNISRITTATSAAVQTENSGVSETNIDDTLLSPAVKTVAGQQTLSRQSIERGTGTEDVTLKDLFRRYATALDALLITEASTGLTNVAQSVAYTDASPTAAELYPKILNASANSEAALLAQAVPNFVVMHSRRWNWLQSQVGTSWPFMTQPGIAAQAGGANYGVGYNAGVRGVLPNGMQVIVDNNIATNLGAGTNEDEIYVVASDECHLWEDPNAPVFIRAEQTAAASLGVLLVVYGYFAYTFARYTNGQSKIAGTGLVTPTF